MPESISPDNEQVNENVSRVEFQAMLERINGISRLLGRLEKNSAKQTETVSPSGGGEPDGLTARIKQLEEKQNRIDTENERLNKRQIANAIARTLAKNGVDPVVADDLAEVHLAKSRDAFKLNDSQEVSNVYNNEEISLDSWAKMFLATDKGSVYLKTKAGPSKVTLPNNRKAVGSKVSITSEQLANGQYDKSIDPSQLEIVD